MRCYLISGAPEEEIGYINASIESGCCIVAIDSGYLKCRKLNMFPDLIIGDFDSAPFPDFSCEIIRLPARKNDTDTFYAVKEMISRGYHEIIILGAVGSRFDHSYSNLLCVHYCIERGIYCEIQNANNRIFAVKGETQIKKDQYQYFSVFAFLEDCAGVTIRGAGYETTDIPLKVTDQFGQSNYVKKDVCKISCKRGCLFIVQSNDSLFSS